MFSFTKYSTIYYIFSGVIIIGAIASLVIFGLKFGIEFTGGSTMELEFTELRPNGETIAKELSSFNIGEVIIQPIRENSMLLKFKGVDEATHQQILSKINTLSGVQEKNFQYIGHQ